MENKKPSKLSIWISAARPRTIPLSLAGIITGAAMAYSEDQFNGIIFTLALFTTVFLQILSNYSNDLGDSIKGTDNENRLGPARAIQSGMLSRNNMILGIIIVALLALLSGVLLLIQSFGKEQLMTFVIFFLLGLTAIWAAIKYTVGKKAYGYSGLGDLFVFIFFGLVSVSGSFYLFTKEFSMVVLLQSCVIGIFSVLVLHLNNMRDRDNDKNSGKRTIAVNLGEKGSMIYFVVLLITSIAFSLSAAYLGNFQGLEWMFILSLFLIILVSKRVFSVSKSADYNRFLKPVALNTFLYSLLLFIGFLL